MDEDLFQLMNKKSSNSSAFDDVYDVRVPLGDVIKSICKCCGSLQIYTVFNSKIEAVVQKGQQTQEPKQLLAVQVEIEGLLFCMTKLAKTLEPS